jgi:hypothetical protein
MEKDFGVSRVLAYGNSKSRVEFSVVHFLSDLMEEQKLKLTRLP